LNKIDELDERGFTYSQLTQKDVKMIKAYNSKNKVSDGSLDVMQDFKENQHLFK